MKILTNYDFNQNQVLNMVVQKLATAPSGATAGQVYYNTTQNRLFYYDGSKWEGSDALDAVMTGADIVGAINSSSSIINDARLSAAVRDAISKAHNTHIIADISGLQTALNGKVDNAQVLTDVPVGAKFTDTITTINNKTGAISKADIVALGIPSQDTVYTHPGTGTNPHGTTKGDLNLGNIDNTSDLNKPVSNATKTALDGKVDNARVLTDVPENAKFTDTIYVHPTSSGDKHIPTGGVSGQILKNSTSGTAVWEDETLTTINGKTGAITKADIVALGIPAQDTNTTYLVFNTTRDGLVPKPVAGETTSFLRGDGTWVAPNDTKYSLPIASPTVLGGVKSGSGITVSASGVVTINDNTHNHTLANITGLETALGSKETPSGAQNKANTAEGNAKTYTDNVIGNLVGGSVEALDTLKELADALGNDPNFASTITNMLGLKTDKFSQALGNGTLTSFSVTHNHNSRDVAIMIRETAAPYAQVVTDVEMTTVNTCTVKFAVAPKLDEYTITVIG